MQWLKQATAVTLKIGPFVDITDGKTVEAGLTIAQANVRLSKNGGNYAQKTEATTCTYDEVGEYGCPVDVTDTDTLGRLTLVVDDAAALPVKHHYMVVATQVYESIVDASDNLQVDMEEISGDATAANNAEAFFDGTGYAGTNNVIPTVTTLTGHTVQTGDSFARIGAAGVSLSDLGGMSTAMKAEVNAEADTALTDYDPPTKAEMDTGHGLLATEAKQDIIDTNVDTLLTRITSTLFSGITSLAEWLGLMAGSQAGDATALTEIQATGAGSGTFDEAEESLEAIRARGDSTWAGSPPTIMQSTTIATLASQTSFTLTAGSADDDAYNGAFALVVDQTTAVQQCICDITDYEGATRTITLGSDPGIFTMAQDDLIYIIAAAPGTAAPTAAQNRAEMDSNSTQLAAIVADSSELQTDWTNGGRLDLLVDAIKAVTDALPDAGALTTIGTDTARLTAVRAAVLTDWINGGRLDLLLDAVKAVTDALPDSGALNDLAAILTDTGTTIPGTITTAQADLDTITGADGVLVATGAITAAAIATDAVDADALAADALAEIKTQADTALTDVNLDHIAGADAPSVPTAGSWLGNLIEDDAGVWRFTTNALEQAPSGAGSNKYEVRGDVTQKETGEVRWVVWCEKNGQPEAITACTVKLVACDGDGTITDYSGATETQNTDDENFAVNGEIADPGFTVGTQDYLHATVTADGDTRIGIVPFKTPARTS